MDKKQIALGVAGLIVAIGLALPLALPENFSVKRQITISASPEKIFNYINNVENWNKWTAWDGQNQPGLQYFYPYIKKDRGAILQWVTEDSSGQMVFDEQKKNEELTYNLYIDKDWDTKGKISLKPQGQETQVEWEFYGKLKYFRRYWSPFMNRMAGPDFEKGLAKLKGILETE